MIIDTDKLRSKARELALQQRPSAAWQPFGRLWREFHNDIRSLHSFIDFLQNVRANCSQPAEEWLLDNAEFLEAQMLTLEEQLSEPSIRRLPHLPKSAKLRVQSLCEDYLEHVDGALDRESLLQYIDAYQEISVLTIAEAWAIPVALRLAIIRRLADVMALVRERREVCLQVESFLSRIGPQAVNPESLRAALDVAAQDIPLSGAWIVHLIGHLREWAEDTQELREWLRCRLENQPDSLDRMLSYERELQAKYQLTAGNLIVSLRKLERWDWREPFEEICMVDRTFRKESTGVYPLLDFTSRNGLRRRVEQLARRLHVPENLVAAQAVELARREHERLRDRRGDPSANDVERQAFVAYYLLEPDGLRKLLRALRLCSRPRPIAGIDMIRRPASAYFTALAGWFAIVLLGFGVWVGGGKAYTPAQWAAILLALALPAGEWAVTAVHWLIERLARPRPLLRYDFSGGIPEEATTMVVIPVIWSTPEEAEEMAERLELHYLANRDRNIHYALLGDFTDAKEESVPEDAAIVAAARAKIEALNAKYGGADGTTFHLLQRRRKWNASEGVWMGWERKRGKLVEFVELLKGRTDTSYAYVIGDRSVYSRIRYVITLDADTQLPAGSAHRMIATMHLPYNRPRLNESGTRIVEGYGVLQPRIAMSHQSTMRTRLSFLWSGEPGIDPYAFAISDPYQDGLGQGIFTGKGIFDVDAFARVLCDRIPENRVLSHDLLEGGFLRAGLLSDIELVDDQPATFHAQQKRLHRWVRGDWQLLCWLLPRALDRNGTPRPVDLSALTRWQIVDNMRRSLLAPSLYAIFPLALTILPGMAGRWFVVALLTLLLPVIRHIVSLSSFWKPMQTLAAIGQALVVFWTLPFQSALYLDAIGRTLYRLWISKRNLLEWVSSAEVERRSRGSRNPALIGMRGGYALIAVAALTSAVSEAGALRWGGFIVSAFWALAPLCVRWLNRPLARPEEPPTRETENYLRELARQIWLYYEDFAGPEDNWLPPDNVQIDPPNGVAHRTSPTNIGLMLASALAARDFGFIDTAGLVERLDRSLATIERMEKWNGHLYNWYDTTTLAPLRPIYVSTVDSGNFVTSLIAVKEGLAEWLQADFAGEAERDAAVAPQREKAAGGPSGTADAEVALDFESAARAEASPRRSREEWLALGKSVVARIEALIEATDFRPLFDAKSRLFTLGYRVDSGERDEVLYDLLASEARQASFVAIALGQVSVSHWFALGRTMARFGRRIALMSWSGTMFEYLMPWLFLRTFRNSLWDRTYRNVVHRQMEYAHSRGVPFGISESGFYALDYMMNYQYRAFGVPGLGFKRGLERDLVIAPYATIMALPFALKEGMEDLQKLENLGARGKYGFYEAVDFTARRMPEAQRHMIVRSFMAHHQGMSLLALANLLLPQKMYDRFHRDKRVRASELLLTERLPARPAVLRRSAALLRESADLGTAQGGPLREYIPPHAPTPEVCVMSNGSLTSVVTDSGGGFIRYEGLAVSRWREDPVADDWGNFMYIRDVTRDEVWSPTFQPCRVPSKSLRALFSIDRAAFRNTAGDVQSLLEICVSPDLNAEVRRLTLTNKAEEARILEVTTYVEVALATASADEAHPAFSKLFVETEFAADAGCLIARRREREEGERPLWAVHALTSDKTALGPAEYETDRLRFIGRGHTLAEPRAIRSRLGKTVGAVADPALILRLRLKLEPGERAQLFAVTGVAETREEAVGIARQLATARQIERAFQFSWTRSQIDLRHLHLSPADAAVYHRLAARVLYAAPIKEERETMIAANTKGQSGLWAHSISGDLPIIVVRIADAGFMPFVVKLLRGHEYLRLKGIPFDLVIVNESPGGYSQPLQEALQRAVEQHSLVHGARSGIFLIAANRLPEEDKTLLAAAARAVLRADGPSLRSQLRAPRRIHPLPKPLAAVKPAERPAANVPAETDELYLFNGWGGFTADGREYRIVLRDGNHLPAPWVNVLANPQFGAIVSELYTGYTWWRNSRECKLTPWSNDPAADPPGEMCFVRDEESGEFWTAAPSRGSLDGPHTVAHGRGYTRFEHENRGLQHEMVVFVPLANPVKVVRLKLKNISGEPRRLSVTYYAEWVLGVHRAANAAHIVTDWDEPASVLLARNAYQEPFRDATAFLAVQLEENAADSTAGAAGKARDLSWTADRLEFLGRGGMRERPAAMFRERLSGRTGAMHDACGAVQVKFTLDPGAEETVYVLLGCERSRENAVRLAAEYRRPGYCDQALREVVDYWDRVCGQLSVSTPSKEMDILLNNWLLYQTLACRIWARTAFYQSGGAFGFRDQLQDALALMHTAPDFARAQILLHAAHQYEEGDVQHWWHEETERGIRTRFSDDALWLPYAVARYVEHTGDDSVLDEMVPYIRSEPLGEDEYERYEPTEPSERRGTIFEHCLRAIDGKLRFGEHGLPLIGIGDWNDGLSRVGAAGRGESVWLGWFLGDVLNRFAELCERKGEAERARRYRSVRDELAANLDAHAWDGQWYRRVFTDGGQWFGSVHNDECRIDAISQSWSVISRMAPEDKMLKAMQSFDRELVDRELSVVRLLNPPFDRTEPKPGYIQGYPPGIRENGAQYTHGIVWSVVAWCMLGEGGKAFELFNMLNPLTHTRTPGDARRYAKEPYVIAADVYMTDVQKGRAGWTWYTGAAGWMYQAGIEWILGLRRCGDRLYIRPCIPREWPGFTARYRYGSASYEIVVDNTASKGGAPTSLTVDGREVDWAGHGTENGPFIELRDDGRVHHVAVTL